MSFGMCQIGDVTAAGWSIGGAITALLLLFIIPELARQARLEVNQGVKYRMTPSARRCVGGILLAVILGAIGLSVTFEPCDKGDAWLTGLGSMSLLSGLLGFSKFEMARRVGASVGGDP